jgi:hypothetical protein
MGQVYHCWWRICREINAFFFRFEYHMFYVLYLFVTYLLTFPCTINRIVLPLCPWLHNILLHTQQEIMGRTNRLLSFKTTRTTQKTKKMGYIQTIR